MSRPRDRISSKGLLPNMEARPLKRGGFSYRLHVQGGKPVPLGREYEAAIRQVLDLTGRRESLGTVKWVAEKFKESARWKRLAEGTRDDYLLAEKQLLARFADMQLSAITAPIVARYVHIERADAPRRANIEKALLSNWFGHGIKLGVCSVNATIGVEPHPSEARTEAPDPAVLAGFLDWIARQTPQRRIIGMAAEYASLAGSRRVEFLDLSWPQVDRVTGVVRTKRAKQRGRKRGEIIEQVEISPALSALLDRLEALRRERNTDCLYVFPTRDNNAYSARGFKTLWQRCMVLAISEGVIKEGDRFTFHDLRAHYATVHKRELGDLPDLHTNAETTARVYDRNKVVRRTAL